ncbi:hypothetical protein SEUCBS140593_010350 [Sporothrix eucalyptigena]|uniref:Major facilitator superfamily (MFS) profile domain-containing protein n=1 Tax=Sporothrix eucalyptigena TaxID=1812306 RepID=A0ABP0D3X0_9PEZI
MPIPIDAVGASPDLKALNTNTQHVEDKMETVDDSGISVTYDESSSIIRSSLWDNKRFLIVAAIVNIANLDYGIDTGMINGFQAMPGFLEVFGYADPTLPGGYGISTTVQQLITSLMAIGMTVSCMSAGPVLHRIGRKGGVWLGGLFVFVSVIMQMLVTSVGALYGSRLIMGAGSGFLLVSSQLYMQEVAPPHLRSFNFSMYSTWVSIGSLVGAVINNRTSSIEGRASYRIPLGVIIGMTFIICVVMIPLPETPRHLAVKGKHEEAYKSLRFLRDAAYSDLQIRREMGEILHAIAVDKQNGDNARFLDIFRHGNLRRTLASVGLASINAASGSQFIIQYGVYFFSISNNGDSFRSSVIVFCCGLIGSLFSYVFSGRVGRRPVLLASTVLQCLCMLGMGVAYSARGLDKTATNTILAMTCIFLFTFCALSVPFSWQVASEIPTQQLRAHTVGIASATSFFLGFVLTFTVPYFLNPTALNWGPKYAYIWVPSNLICTVFIFFCVPETNQRTLEELDEAYLSGISVRKFKSFRAVGAMQARRDAVQSEK